jgi:DNA-binding Lrp family transcriptional regulator
MKRLQSSSFKIGKLVLLTGGLDLREVDEKDIAILDLLRENARATYQELSTKLAQFGVDISTVGVLKRVQHLKEKGVIKHFTIKTDPEKLGLTTPILILIRLRPKPFKDFVNDIQCPELEDPRVLSLFTLAHQYNLALFGIWESKEEYGKWKTRLLTRLDSVLETNELFVLDSYKEEDDSNIRIPAHIEQEIDQARHSKS